MKHPPGSGALGSAALTGLSLVVVTGAAAVIGVVIAREFGRTEETDGLLAAYGVFVVIVVAAQAIRIAVLPQLAWAEKDGRLAGTLAGYAGALVLGAVPLVLAAELASDPLGDLLTGSESAVAGETAADALRWIVPAGVAHVFAGLAASGLAALDDYVTAALGFAAGSAAGLALIVSRVDQDGVIAVAWGLALNGTIALAVPMIGLAIHARRVGMPTSAVRPTGPPLAARLRAFVVAAALPVAVQLLYVVSLPFAARLGSGAATSFVYAYLAATALVTVTAGSLGLVTSVPLARGELAAGEISRHVVSASWFALLFVGVAAGAVAVAGGKVVGALLGESYGGDVGSDLGRLIVVLSPWMIAAIGVSLTFPLAFVAGRTRALPWIAIGVLALQIPLAWIGASLLDLEGLAIALSASTLVVLVALLLELDALAATARGLVAAAAIVGGMSVVAFVPPALVFGAVATAVIGTLAYAALVALLRPRGLVGSYRYLRQLR